MDNVANGYQVQMDPAQPRGFCAGVVCATEILGHAPQICSPPVYVRHETVQNKHVMESLKNKGATLVEFLSEVPPLPAHPETEGTLGQVSGLVCLVRNVTAVAILPLRTAPPMAYITQTMLSVDGTNDNTAALWARFKDVQGPDIRDICYATQSRQSAVRDLDKLVDVTLAVGAANCSNSNRLREVGTEADVASNLIADGSKLNPDWLKDAKAVGIIAGASASEVLNDNAIEDNAIEDNVIEALRRIRPVAVSVVPRREENIEFRLPAGLVAG